MWKKYEQEILNEEKKWNEKLIADKNKEPCQKVTENNVLEALCCMKTGKAKGPSRVTSDLVEV